MFGNFLIRCRKIDWKATDVTLVWNLARNPGKNSSKIRRKNAKFELFAIELMNILFFFARIERSGLTRKLEKVGPFNQFCENKINKLENNCRKFWNLSYLWKLFNIILHSILFNRVLSCGEVRSGTSLGSPSTCRAWRHRQGPLTRSITLERRSRSKKNCSG